MRFGFDDVAALSAAMEQLIQDYSPDLTGRETSAEIASFLRTARNACNLADDELGGRAACSLRVVVYLQCFTPFRMGST